MRPSTSSGETKSEKITIALCSSFLGEFT